ncbi:putative TAM domain methyltransferase [Colletotrichum sublineola]|uniref:Putative TAM domain methyltransferase n=1 Tax=Colletotrichum sublineola TaxID=1173701 RepID=A0A066WUS6_COLSU|nr:putative TAM domain methyltransferase [Colletotrichum sublineola]
MHLRVSVSCRLRLVGVTPKLTIGGSQVANISTDSPTPSVVTFEEENGRTYHSMSPGKYPFPNDTIEQERLGEWSDGGKPACRPGTDRLGNMTTALQHQIWDVTLNHKLCMCPKNYGRAKNVLDAGTGTGLWAIDYADAHPEAKVVARISRSPAIPPLTDTTLRTGHRR